MQHQRLHSVPKVGKASQLLQRRCSGRDVVAVSETVVIAGEVGWRFALRSGAKRLHPLRRRPTQLLMWLNLERLLCSLLRLTIGHLLQDQQDLDTAVFSWGMQMFLLSCSLMIVPFDKLCCFLLMNETAQKPYRGKKVASSWGTRRGVRPSTLVIEGAGGFLLNFSSIKTFNFP